MARKMSVWDVLATFLVIVGGIAWGVYAFGPNIVELMLGTGFWSKLVFFLVGVSAVWSSLRLLFR